MISSAQPSDLQASPMFAASLKAMMVAEIFIRLVDRFRQCGKFAKAHITQG
jgi:hypothetical protein